jgi:hypothetical protein
VTDSSGAVLPGVTVHASSPALIERVRTAVTDARGVYAFKDLPPGEYELTFALSGFSSVAARTTLGRARTERVHASLTAGSIEETLTVSGERPAIDPESRSARTAGVPGGVGGVVGGAAGGVSALPRAAPAPPAPAAPSHHETDLRSDSGRRGRLTPRPMTGATRTRSAVSARNRSRRFRSTSTPPPMQTSVDLSKTDSCRRPAPSGSRS